MGNVGYNKGRQTEIKRTIYSILTLALCVLVLATLFGCGGGDKTRAKEIFDEAQEILSEIDAITTEMMALAGTLNTTLTSGDIEMIKELQGGTRESFIMNLRNRLENYEMLNETLHKMDSLKDIGDYEKYKELILERYDQAVSIDNIMLGLYEGQIVPLYEKLDAGEPVDIALFTKQMKEDLNGIFEMMIQVADTRNEAKEFVKEKNL